MWDEAPPTTFIYVKYDKKEIKNKGCKNKKKRALEVRQKLRGTAFIDLETPGIWIGLFDNLTHENFNIVTFKARESGDIEGKNDDIENGS